MVSAVGSLLTSTAVTPDGLELVEQAVDVTHDIDPSPHDPLAAPPVLGDEVGPLEHRDVLLHRGEAHREPPGQVGHRVLVLQHQAHDVPPGRIGQRVEQQVGPLGLTHRCIDNRLIYNHMVVD
jgi:hypothetical protein